LHIIEATTRTNFGQDLIHKNKKEEDKNGHFTLPLWNGTRIDRRPGRADRIGRRPRRIGSFSFAAREPQGIVAKLPAAGLTAKELTYRLNMPEAEVTCEAYEPKKQDTG
jgi:hypothetical protein